MLGKVIVIFARIYQNLFSPFLGERCRFFPSCSNYTILAVEKFGAVKGGILALKRISRCHPFHVGGVDEP